MFFLGRKITLNNKYVYLRRVSVGACSWDMWWTATCVRSEYTATCVRSE